MYVIERFRVADYDTWKAAFDDHVDARIRHGAVGHRVLRDENNPDQLTLVVEFTSRGGAYSAEHHDVSLLEAIRRGGVVGGPHQFSRRIDYLDVVEAADYSSCQYA
jgi:hypothetical protein